MESDNFYTDFMVKIVWRLSGLFMVSLIIRMASMGIVWR